MFAIIYLPKLTPWEKSNRNKMIIRPRHVFMFGVNPICLALASSILLVGSPHLCLKSRLNDFCIWRSTFLMAQFKPEIPHLGWCLNFHYDRTIIKTRSHPTKLIPRDLRSLAVILVNLAFLIILLLILLLICYLLESRCNTSQSRLRW